jgi:tRNA(fMet)-specific endonuclease VapC
VSGNYRLATNIRIAWYAGEHSVLDHLRDTHGVFIPSIVISELYFGAHKSSKASNKLRRIEAFIAGNIILACDAVTAFHYGNIKE